MGKNKNETLIDLSSPLSQQSASSVSSPTSIKNSATSTTTTAGKSTTIYPTATATITKTGNIIDVLAGTVKLLKA